MMDLTYALPSVGSCRDHRRHHGPTVLILKSKYSVAGQPYPAEYDLPRARMDRCSKELLEKEPDQDAPRWWYACA